MKLAFVVPWGSVGGWVNGNYMISKNVMAWNFFDIGGSHTRDGQIVETDKLPETTSHLSVKMGRAQFLTNSLGFGHLGRWFFKDDFVV